jgi:hypothetical protein
MITTADLKRCEETITQAVTELQARRDNLLLHYHTERDALARTVGNLIAAREALERARPVP